MPIYEYQCKDCGEEFEKFVRSMNSQEEIICPKCGSSETKKAFSVFGVSSGQARSSASSSCAPTGG
jgi:putative FmdB family regulatory protein